MDEVQALLEAVKRGDLPGVERLLEQNPGIDVDSLNFYGYTALIWCIRNAYTPIVEVLLAHGAAVNGPVGAPRTPLQEACSLISNARSRSEIVSLLLEHGAAVDAMTAVCRRTPLTLAICYPNTNLDIIQLLLNAGADVNGGGGIIAPLHQAAYAGNTEVIDLLLQSGDVNILSTANYSNWPAGSTPLHFAAKKEYLNTLLAAGADPYIANSAGDTPLHDAALLSSVDAVNALLAAGADPLHRDNRGHTPLQYLHLNRRNFSAVQFNITTALVAAGDRSWQCVPTPCPGLEAAMLSVWQNAPDELPELLKRMENPPQNLIELFPRMDEEMKIVVQEVLRGLPLCWLSTRKGAVNEIYF